MNMLTNELKKVKQEVKGIRVGDTDLYEEGFVRRRAKEDYGVV